ncbi:hypothetical protein HN784_01960 [bacterium]|jgi:FMN phosphatase YigB (HAD superfamily)|nr:hypothetical protein [bacterium]MBT4251052.1 hypothetical protein [bacterium]MBT4597957.1 hypothetical protein [bacterium]MBT6753474.1 hypothetical protein [bacterium]MBT7037999.1 hypothetical protein [bacterium]
MKIVFDLDHTLFRTNLFKNDLFEILQSAGAESRIIQETYQEHCKKEAGGAYDFEEHCLKIKKKTEKFEEEGAKRMFKKFIKKADFSKYIENETYDFLTKQKKVGNKLILLTMGGDFMQKAKVEKTGLIDVFDEFIVCRDTKLNKLESLALEKGDLFVNDIVSETLMVKKKFPFINYIILALSDPMLEFQDYSKLKTIPVITSIRSLKIPLKTQN